MKQFFEWGFKALVTGACWLAVSYMQDISKTITAMDAKFASAITKLETQAPFIQGMVKDHEERIRTLEQQRLKIAPARSNISHQ